MFSKKALNENHLVYAMQRRSKLFGITKAELEDVREAMRVYTVPDKVADVKAKHKQGLRAI